VPIRDLQIVIVINCQIVQNYTNYFHSIHIWLPPPQYTLSKKGYGGEYDDQADAEWIVIRTQLRGHDDTPFGRPAPGRPSGTFRVTLYNVTN
jgi:hypothetical protein